MLDNRTPSEAHGKPSADTDPYPSGKPRPEARRRSRPHGLTLSHRRRSSRICRRLKIGEFFCMDSLLEKLRRDRRKGSTSRCHWLTHGSPGQVASRLNALAEPGCVSADDHWMPEGFDHVEEAQLHQAPRLLPRQDCEALGDWWLKEQSDDSKTPNWDIASTCTVNGHKGLLLVEAKAHTQELKVKDQAGGSLLNRARITECIKEANAALVDQTELDWALSHQHRYQMANRFAWCKRRRDNVPARRG